MSAALPAPAFPVSRSSGARPSVLLPLVRLAIPKVAATRRIWRLEHVRDGRGVYCTGAVYEAVEAAGFERPEDASGCAGGPLQDDRLRRFWQDLTMREAERHWFFGFAGLDQYRAWFPLPSLREALAAWHRLPGGPHLAMRQDDHGAIRLRLYEAPRRAFRRGSFQAVFRRAEARLLEDLSPAEVPS